MSTARTFVVHEWTGTILAMEECKVVQVASDNLPAMRAVEDDDVPTLVRTADTVWTASSGATRVLPEWVRRAQANTLPPKTYK